MEADDTSTRGTQNAGERLFHASFLPEDAVGVVREDRIEVYCGGTDTSPSRIVQAVFFQPKVIPTTFFGHLFAALRRPRTSITRLPAKLERHALVVDGKQTVILEANSVPELDSLRNAVERLLPGGWSVVPIRRGQRRVTDIARNSNISALSFDSRGTST